MGGPLYHETTGKPVWDQFGLPVACAHDDDPETPPPCCPKCASWANCLARSPLLVKLGGLDFANWLPWMRFHPHLLQSAAEPVGFTIGDPANNDTETTAFIGEFLLLPSSPLLASGDCGVDALSCGLGSHYWPGYRTLYAPESALADPYKRFSLKAGYECWEDEGVSYLKFVVYLYYEFEAIDEIISYMLPSDWAGANLDLSAIMEQGVACCPILESDPIATDTLAWEDLQDIPLHEVGPGDFVLGGNEAILDGGMSCASVSGWMYKAAFRTTPPPPVCEPGRTNVQDCDPGSPGFVSPVLACSAELCAPPPIELASAAAGDYALSVVAPSCTPPLGCKNCPTTTPGEVAAPVAIDFTVSPGGCHKTFRAVYPDCITPLEFYWSFGARGATASHTIVNHEGTGANGVETITLVIVDDRGCVYCATREVDCDCCVDVNGSLTATEIAACSYELSASVSDTAECPQPFILWWLGSQDCPAIDADCYCDETGEFICECAGSLGDGQTTIVNVEGADTLYWRVMDGPCGCVGPRQEIDLHCSNCDCCIDAIDSVAVTLSGWSNGSCSNCGSVAGTWILPRVGACWYRLEQALGSGECGSTLIIDATIECNPEGGTARLHLFVQWLTNSVFQKNITFTPLPAGTPIDCSLLEGVIPQITSTNSGQCDSAGQTATVSFA